MTNPTRALLILPLVLLGSLDARASGFMCEDVFKLKPLLLTYSPAVVAAPADAQVRMNASRAARLASAMTPTDAKIINSATNTIFSSFTSPFQFREFVRKAAPELAYEMNWDQSLAKVVNEFFSRLSRRPDFDQVAKDLAANYRAQFTGRGEESKAAIDAIQNVQSRTISRKGEPATVISIETQLPETRAILEQIVAALTHSFSANTSFELQRILPLERRDLAQMNWNCSSHDNVVDLVNLMLRAPNFRDLANQLIEKYKTTRAGKYPGEAALFARFAEIQPRAGRAVVRERKEIEAQTPEDRASLIAVRDLLMKSFTGPDTLQSFVTFKVYNSNGQSIRSLVNWDQSFAAVTTEFLNVMINQPNFTELAARMAEGYRAERSQRVEDFATVDRLGLIHPRVGAAPVAGKTVVVLTKSESASLREASEALMKLRAEDLQSLLRFSVPSLARSVKFAGAPTREIAVGIIDGLLLGGNYAHDAGLLAQAIRAKFSGNPALAAAATALESAHPQFRAAQP